MGWLVALLPLVAVAQPQTTTFDFEAKAAPVAQVIERLSTQTSTRLKATAKLERTVLLVRAHAVTLADLKAKIAEAVHGAWTKEGDTEYLTRRTAEDRAIWDAHVALRRKYVDAELAEAKKVLEKPFDAKALATGLLALPDREEARNNQALAAQRYQREAALFAQGPLARLLVRLILACNPNDLAAVGPFERTYFTLAPTRMQRGFDRKRFEAALSAYAAEQQTWIEEAARTSFVEDPEGRMVSDPRAQIRHKPDQQDFALEVKRGEMTSLLFVNLIGDSSGPFTTGVVCQKSFADPARRFLDAQMTPAPPDEKDPLVPLSDDSREFTDRMNSSVRLRTPEPLSARMRELMLGVEKNDPLSWTVSDALMAYAQAKDLNLVAALPDTSLAMAYFISREAPLRMNAFVKGLLDSGTLAKNDKEGWRVLSPPDRYEAELDFTPRRAAAALAKAVLTQGRLDIRDYALYAFDSKRLNRGGFGDWFLAMIDRSVLGASDRTDWKSLQLYGSFSTLQQQSLESGGRFAYGAMVPYQRKIVERIVYAGKIRSEVQGGGGTASLKGKPVEPTEAFPMGVPAGCTVTARAKSVPTLVAYGKGSDGKVRPLRSVTTYTLAVLEVDSPGDPQMMERYGLKALVGYAPGAEKMLALRVTLGPETWTESPITLSDYDPNATPVTWDKLPDPYPKQIADAINQVKEQRANQPGRKIPPR